MTLIDAEIPARTDIVTVPRFVELELTKNCQLACAHCLTTSYPGAGNGAMKLADWMETARQAHELGAETIQLIGGEPTVSPVWMELLEYILSFPGLYAQVFSNLYSITARHWKALRTQRVRMGTSYYSDSPEQHDRITGKPGSFERTRGNIVKALGYGVPLTIGIVRVLDGQRVDEAVQDLLGLGIPRGLIKVDRARGVGRANPLPGADAPVSELCGGCGDGRIAILPSGDVVPCVLGRALKAGNLLRDGITLASILQSDVWAEFMRVIPRGARGCPPGDSNDCDPANTTACAPAYPKLSDARPLRQVSPTIEG